MNVIIWSKNRACQLDLLLRSIEKYWVGYKNHIFNVIYTADTEFESAYSELFVDHQWVDVWRETNLKDEILDSIHGSDYTMFLCDDDVFTREYKSQPSIPGLDVACISLRMGKNIMSHYIKGDSPAPKLNNGFWDWRGGNIDWGYPMSAGSGHIFRTLDIMPIVKNGTYNNPTEFEDAMNAMKINRPLMFCYEHSIVFNMAINRVQTRRNTLCGEISAKELNTRYMNGERIDIEQFHKYDNKSAHVILKDLKWSN
jgi:hypothetical protein